MSEPDHTLALLRRLDRKVDRLEAGQRLVLARLDRHELLFHQQPEYWQAMQAEIGAEQDRQDLRLDHLESPVGDVGD